MAASQRQWGWHELDPQWARRLVADARIAGSAVVLDVGAGLGAITEPLIATGARVIAVEPHPERARYLRERFGNAVVVVQADARDLRLPRRPYQVVANPPFGVTSALIRRLLQPGSRLLSAHLILQEQAVRRWAEGDAPGARRWERTFEISSGCWMPRSAFRPRPHVGCRVLVIKRRTGA